MANDGAPHGDGRRALAISNAITHLHREHYGRGPDRAHTIIQRNYVITFLDDLYTQVERTLIDAGKGELVREVRTTFQYSLREEFIGAVHDIVGRRPRAFMSQIDCDADMAVEFFLLENGEGDVSDVTQD